MPIGTTKGTTVIRTRDRELQFQRQQSSTADSENSKNGRPTLTDSFMAAGFDWVVQIRRRYPQAGIRQVTKTATNVVKSRGWGWRSDSWVAGKSLFK